MSDIQVGVRINLAGNLPQQLSGIKSQFTDLSNTTRVISLATLSQSLSSLSLQTKNLSENLKRPFVEFEREMASIRARMLDVSDDSFARLREQAKELGATTIFTSTQIAQGMDKLAMAGFQANEIQASIADVTAFVQANRIDFATGADIATDIGTAFSYEAGEISEVLDVLTYAANSSNTNVSMLGETMKYVAADANNLGLSLQQTVTMAGIVANAGIKGSMGGTTLKEMVNAIAAPDDKAKKVLERLKIKVYDDAGEMREIEDVLRDINDATKNLTQQQRKEDIQAVFKDRGSRGILTIMSQGQDAFEEFLDSVYHKSNETVIKAQEVMAKSLAAGLAGIQSRKEALFTTITESGREQLAGVQKIKIGFLDHLNNIAKENTVLSGHVSLATQLLSDIGGVLTSGGAVLSTILSGFTALSTFRSQKAVEGMAQNPLGLQPGQPLPVWVVNNSGQATQATTPRNSTVMTGGRVSPKTQRQSKIGAGIKGGLISLGFNAASLGMQAIAIKSSDLNEKAQKRALKDTFSRSAWGIFGGAAGGRDRLACFASYWHEYWYGIRARNRRFRRNPN